MIIGKFGNKTYLQDVFGNIGSITENSSGSTVLTIVDRNKHEVLKKRYKSRKGALRGWNYFSRTNKN